ncbi:Dam family site-specific DNA-(adenine-N6)-methyltransferase [Metabacillus sp. Hm71]|uniref:Dam family site-specific DNA-(adenine-N6)-methyltransferase n=1 Tax=Metabacillus sp. Hm71 TaxID=3450743 RepID=UPI003F4435CA
MGNKKRLIQKGLTDIFPKDIDTFYDLFGGSGVVSLNVNANNYILNELDTYIYNLYITLKENKPEVIIDHIKNCIKEFDLPTKSTNSATTNKEEREYYKVNYTKFRSRYNESKNPLDLFVLMNYCLSQTMRFNQKGDFNMPFGNNRFIEEKHGQYYIDFHRMINNDNFLITNKSFEDFGIHSFKESDFLYLDPPYTGTTATYNENGKWDTKNDEKLLKFCDELSEKGIRFAMSNAFENKNVRNEMLIEWCNKNRLNVYTFDKFSYHAYGKGDANTTEVLITNYK